MIILPPAPMEATPSLIDNGFIQRTAAGGPSDKINRKGNRYRVSAQAGPFPPHIGREWIADLIAGKREGVRMKFPLQWSQAGAGLPVVDGAGQAGTSLNIRSATQGFVVRKGFFLSIENAGGHHFVHSVKSAVRVSANGTVTLPLGEELREPFADGDKIHIASPFIEGWVDGDEFSWELSVNQAIPISFTIEEAA